MVELGYGCCWRVLDAQYCRVDGFPRAVPQQRRRVFVVGYFGDWRGAAGVLFDAASLSRDPPPRREAEARAARPLAAGTDGSGGYRNDADTADQNLIAAPKAATLATTMNADYDGRESHLVAFGGNRTSARDVATALTGHPSPHGRLDPGVETLIAQDVAATLTRGAESQGRGGYAGRRQEDDVNLVAFSLTAAMAKSASRMPREQGALVPYDVAHTLRAEGFDATEDGSRRGIPLVLGLNGRQDPNFYGEKTGALDTDPGTQIVAFQNRFRGDDGRGYDRAPPGVVDRTGTLETVKAWNIAGPMGVRRLMPVECERLQGFPDGYTAIPYRKKPAKDGPRYQALGNSMAVNVMRWLGRRIEFVETIMKGGSP